MGKYYSLKTATVIIIFCAEKKFLSKDYYINNLIWKKATTNRKNVFIQPYMEFVSKHANVYEWLMT